MRYGMLSIGLVLVSACVVDEVPCSERPDEAVCREDAAIDGGPRDAGGCSETCDGATPVCDVETSTCVACVEDGDCEGDAVCTAHRCVECSGSGDCSEPTPVCSSMGRCVECATGDDCDTATPMCVASECVECTANAQCTTAGASRCASGECAECVADPDCTHLSGLGVCDAGTCVECTSTKNAACEGKVCDAVANTCTTHDPHTAGACQTCVADAHCREGMLCVEEVFRGDELGPRCFWRRDAPSGPSGVCANARPYVRSRDVISVDGATGEACGLDVSTCQAHADFRRTNCATPTAPAYDPACGATGVDDGYCAESEPGVNNCTVGCAVSADCPCAGAGCAEQYECTVDLVCRLTSS